MSVKRRRPDTLFWAGRQAEVGDELVIDPDEAHHARVFRVRVGDTIELADGHGNRLRAVVVEDSKKRFRVAIDGVQPSPLEPPAELHLAFPPLRPGRTETLLEKGTELGVTAFVPVLMERGRRAGNTSRWPRVIRSAAMQCGRCRLPDVSEPMKLDDWLDGLDPAWGRLAARPGGDAQARPSESGTALLVGPEGDLTPEEWALVDAAGFRGVSLGPRRLRAETAAIALLARLL